MEIIERLEALRERALAALAVAASTEELERWRVEYLGRRGALTEVLRSLGSLPPAERPAAGQAANALKTLLESALAKRTEELKAAELAATLERERVDVTLPGRPAALGGLHLTTLVVEQILDIFRDLGFRVVEGPEVELDYYNFAALNIPEDHPARDMWDTFYLRPPDVLLRTHTSPNQVRIMERMPPPVRVVVPGRCYRYEAQDASHEWMFYQVEGLAVDVGLTMADLKGVLVEFARQMFWPDVQCHFRCSYFPFVEPGMEMAIQCHVCRGQGCRVCQGGGWIELLGAGMVHPAVLRNAGYDPARVRGFAFGMGPERIAMVKYGIDDIRLFYSNDLRFLEQFR
ncbi:MAG TPA: phenylalanine--tRNA ligase subunit alpha [Chloroflexota bacterium]|nr:phenylalanine--tRNA ligase subunit alpha [Chloroflexota bacterium]